MKKIITAITLAAICVSLSSCGAASVTHKTANTPKHTSTPHPTATPLPTPTVLPTEAPPKSPSGDDYLVSVCPPYELKAAETFLKIEGQAFQMAGTDQSNGITLGYEDSYVLINLKNKYQELNFNIGHLDKSEMDSCNVTFFLDGQAVKSMDIDAEAMPQNVTIPLNKASQIKILKTSKNRRAYVGLSEMIVK